jgi:rhamnulokinase
MKRAVSFLAVDLGASSGRVMDCRWDGCEFDLKEVHRFPNAGIQFGSDLHWDVLRIWAEIKNGLMNYRSHETTTPSGIAVDAWGVDYCLLDSRSRLIGNPYHYRDARTRGIPESLASIVGSKELFESTGVQTMEINTSFQLASMILHRDQQIHRADTLLMIPDLFQFLLSGHKCAEYTEATTTQLFDLRARSWSQETIAKLKLPSHIFPRVVMPGEALGSLRTNVVSDCGFSQGFPCIATASHDTASAVAAIPNLAESSVVLSSGTWSLMGIVLKEPNLTEEAYQKGFTNEGSADGGVLLLKNLTGLWLLQECVRIWEAAGKQYKWAELEQAAEDVIPFRSIIDPSAADLQAPADMVAAIASYCARSGQPIPSTPSEFARCTLESLSLAYREVVDDLEKITGRTLSTIHVVGGGSLNQSLCQMTADACGREVIAGPVEAAALGNAILQAVATGHIGNLGEGQSALRQSVNCRSYAPVPGHAWSEGYERYKSLVMRRREIESAAVRV